MDCIKNTFQKYRINLDQVEIVQLKILETQSAFECHERILDYLRDDELWHPQ